MHHKFQNPGRGGSPLHPHTNILMESCSRSTSYSSVLRYLKLHSPYYAHAQYVTKVRSSTPPQRTCTHCILLEYGFILQLWFISTEDMWAHILLCDVVSSTCIPLSARYSDYWVSSMKMAAIVCFSLETTSSLICQGTKELQLQTGWINCHLSFSTALHANPHASFFRILHVAWGWGVARAWEQIKLSIMPGFHTEFLCRDRF